MILANAFQKKAQKTPKKEIEQALKIKAEYEADKAAQKNQNKTNKK